MEIYTIGFGRKTAEEFFGILRDSGIRTLVDVRLNNTSQLAAYTKKSDLPFFLREICNAGYVHEPLLAPTPEIFEAVKKRGESWEHYSHDFIQLMQDREVETRIDRSLFAEPAVLLCSEPEPESCHRSLVAEYLRQKWDNVTIVHL